MNSLSFDIKTTIDFYRKLLEDYREYSLDESSSRLALNCAMTAWHLTDWTYNEYNSQLVSHFPTLSFFQQKIKLLCPSLQIMHDLANGTKHYHLTRHTPIIDDTKLHQGTFDNSFSRAFDITTLDIKLKDGTKVYFEDEIDAVIIFWRHYLQSTFNVVI